VLGRATGNTDTQDSPRPGLGGSHHLPPYSILWTSPRGPHPNGFSLPGLPHGSPEISPSGTIKTLEPITLRVDLGSKCGLKQSCSSRRELFNDMWHVVYSQVNRVDCRLFSGWESNWQLNGLLLGLHPCNPFALVASPKLGLQHFPPLEKEVNVFIDT